MVCRHLLRWNPVSWLLAAAIVVVGGVWLSHLLMANGPGDTGPVIGAAVADKVGVGLVLGTLVVCGASAIGWLAAIAGDRLAARWRR